MSGFDTPDLQLSGFPEQQFDSTAESWKRFAAATLMATAALLLCAVVVMILAPLLPHPTSILHAASLSQSPLGAPARG
jgi:hypothetical protein